MPKTLLNSRTPLAWSDIRPQDAKFYQTTLKRVSQIDALIDPDTKVEINDEFHNVHRIANEFAHASLIGFWRPIEGWAAYRPASDKQPKQIYFQKDMKEAVKWLEQAARMEAQIPNTYPPGFRLAKFSALRFLSNIANKPKSELEIASSSTNYKNYSLILPLYHGDVTSGTYERVTLDHIESTLLQAEAHAAMARLHTLAANDKKLSRMLYDAEHFVLPTEEGSVGLRLFTGYDNAQLRALHLNDLSKEERVEYYPYMTDAELLSYKTEIKTSDYDETRHFVLKDMEAGSYHRQSTDRHNDSVSRYKPLANKYQEEADNAPELAYNHVIRHYEDHERAAKRASEMGLDYQAPSGMTLGSEEAKVAAANAARAKAENEVVSGLSDDPDTPFTADELYKEGCRLESLAGNSTSARYLFKAAAQHKKPHIKAMLREADEMNIYGHGEFDSSQEATEYVFRLYKKARDMGSDDGKKCYEDMLELIVLGHTVENLASIHKQGFTAEEPAVLAGIRGKLKALIEVKFTHPKTEFAWQCAAAYPNYLLYLSEKYGIDGEANEAQAQTRLKIGFLEKEPKGFPQRIDAERGLFYYKNTSALSAFSPLACELEAKLLQTTLMKDSGNQNLQQEKELIASTKQISFDDVWHLNRIVSDKEIETFANEMKLDADLVKPFFGSEMLHGTCKTSTLCTAGIELLVREKTNERLTANIEGERSKTIEQCVKDAEVPARGRGMFRNIAATYKPPLLLKSAPSAVLPKDILASLVHG